MEESSMGGIKHSRANEQDRMGWNEMINEISGTRFFKENLVTDHS
jgi:hypothetical protein